MEATHIKLFGTSGVRGIVHKELSVELLYDLGRAIGSSLPPLSQIAIATDTRLSREKVKTTLVMGLISSGVNVIDLGGLPTPALGFATREMGATAGIMVTASHNPPEYNGAKLFNGDGIGYSREQELNIEEIYSQKRFRTGVPSTVKGEHDAKQRYFTDIIRRFGNSLEGKFRVVVDPGNGAASNFASELFSRLGLEVLPLNDTPDGSFPGRSPEPREDTLVHTHGFLLEQHADLAVCFDGDADRVVFLDREGFIPFNEAVAFAACLAVKASGKKQVAATVETGMLLDLVLARLGAHVERSRVGDVPVAYLARDIDAALGVEPVGVYIMPEMGFFPNSFLAALTLLKSIQSVSEIRRFFDDVPKLVTKQKRLPCPNKLKDPVMNQVMANTTRFGQGKVNTVDGFRLDSEHWWMLVRPSGTEPLVRIIAESPSERETDQLIARASSVVEEIIRGIE
jgi:phosphoglucosamine mutase